ncbi:MAG: type II toxin-antitoxin system VapB family antitoxin [Bacteroidales bacterium]|jgi:hypothetical protein|nr:type II toxin-antitoxin system VapB family antitoxin [Bacteroidales bacterium]
MEQAINNHLITEAFICSNNVASEKDIIEIALKEYIVRRKAKSIRDLKNHIHFDDEYDYKSMRK